MKAIVCDICGGKLQIGAGGIATCENCGMEYTKERMQEKIQEMNGAAPEPVTVQSGTSQVVENYFSMAESALQSGNNSEAETYCNKVIELRPQDYKAWFCKGKATAWQSTFAHIRIAEAVNCWSNAISYCPEDKVSQIRELMDQEMTSLTIAMFNLAAGFLESGMNQHKQQAFLTHVKSILSCLEIYSSKINVKYKWARSMNQGIVCAAPHLVKSANAVKDLFHRLKPTSVDVRQDYMQEIVMCADIAVTLAKPDRVNAKAKAACYQACLDIFNILNNMGSYHWFDGQAIYRTDVCGKYFGSDVLKYANLVREWNQKIPEEQQQEYWEDHPEEHKAFLKKQEEERIARAKAEREQKEREMKTEREIQNAKSDFWKNNGDQKLAIEKELNELLKTRNALLSANSGVEQIKLIDERSHRLDEILSRDRRGKISFDSYELQVLSGQDEFASKMQKAAHYDSYLDTYPILKEKAEVEAQSKALNAEKEKLSSLHPEKRFLLIGGIVFVLLGALFFFLGSASVLDSGLLVALAVIVLIGGAALLIAGICKYFAVFSKKSELENTLKKLKAKEEKIAQIPAYTKDFDAKTAAKQIEKSQKKSNFKKKLIIVGISSLLVLIIAFVLILNFLLIPQQKYDDAMSMMQENRYLEAYVLFNEVKNFKDAQYHMDTMLQSNPMLALSVAQNGDIFKFGHYDQDGDTSNGKEEIEWIVLEVSDNKALLLSKAVLDSQPFHSGPRVENFESSSLYAWLQNNFLNSAFDSSEKDNIIGEISIPSQAQKEQYSISYDAEQTIVAQNNGEQCVVFYPDTRRFWTWWLQDVYSKKTEAYIGTGSVEDLDGKYGVRPIIWVELN